MKRFAIGVLLLATSISYGQTLKDYLQQRKMYGISQAAGVESLDTLVGTRVIEIKGLVKGTFRAGGRQCIMLEKADGSTEVIDAEKPPSWLYGGEIPVRLLVRAHREDESSQLHVDLLCAAAEQDVNAVDVAAAKRREAEKKKQLSSRSSAVAKAPTPGREWNLPASEVTPIYAGFIKRYNPRLANEQAFKIAEGVVGFSIRYGVDARLIMALLIAESGFNPRDTSHSGAMGLGQLMPGTAKDLGVSNPYDMTQNLYGTVKLLSQHLASYKAKTGDDFQSLVLSLAAYNAGEGAVRRHGGVPPYRETQNYIRKIIGLYKGFAGLK